MIEYGYSQDLASLFSLKAQSLFGGNVESQLIGQLLTDYQSPRMMYIYGEK